MTSNTDFNRIRCDVPANDPWFAPQSNEASADSGMRTELGTCKATLASIPQVLAPTATLSLSVMECLASRLSANTHRSYAGDVLDFLAWGGHIPSTPHQLAEYIADRAASHSMATVRRRIAGISAAHVRQALEDPSRSTLVKTVMRGAKRRWGQPQRQVDALSPESIARMVEALHGLRGQRDRALLLTGFAAALRRSELVALDVADVGFRINGMAVHLRSSKTDQEHDGRTVFVPNGRPLTCPVSALKAWMQIAEITSGPIFRAISGSRRVGPRRLSDQSVALIIKRHAPNAGIAASSVSGHSLRAGWITSAARAGATDHELRRHSGHRTPAMVARYIRRDPLQASEDARSVL